MRIRAAVGLVVVLVCSGCTTGQAPPPQELSASAASPQPTADDPTDVAVPDTVGMALDDALVELGDLEVEVDGEELDVDQYVTGQDVDDDRVQLTVEPASVTAAADGAAALRQLNPTRFEPVDDDELGQLILATCSAYLREGRDLQPLLSQTQFAFASPGIDDALPYGPDGVRLLAGTVVTQQNSSYALDEVIGMALLASARTCPSVVDAAVEHLDSSWGPDSVPAQPLSLVQPPVITETDPAGWTSRTNATDEEISRFVDLVLSHDPPIVGLQNESDEFIRSVGDDVCDRLNDNPDSFEVLEDLEESQLFGVDQEFGDVIYFLGLAQVEWCIDVAEVVEDYQPQFVEDYETRIVAVAGASAPTPISERPAALAAETDADGGSATPAADQVASSSSGAEVPFATVPFAPLGAAEDGLVAEITEMTGTQPDSCTVDGITRHRYGGPDGLTLVFLDGAYVGWVAGVDAPLQPRHVDGARVGMTVAELNDTYGETLGSGGFAFVTPEGQNATFIIEFSGDTATTLAGELAPPDC